MPRACRAADLCFPAAVDTHRIDEREEDDPVRAARRSSQISEAHGVRGNDRMPVRRVSRTSRQIR